jgi:hypothetical protein
MPRWTYSILLTPESSQWRGDPYTREALTFAVCIPIATHTAGVSMARRSCRAVRHLVYDVQQISRHLAKVALEACLASFTTTTTTVAVAAAAGNCTGHRKETNAVGLMDTMAVQSLSCLIYYCIRRA